MVTLTRNCHPSSAADNVIPFEADLAERVRHYFADHPEVSRKEFLLAAVRKEVHLREQEDNGSGSRHARPEGRRTRQSFAYRRPLSNEDVRLHVWLNERLAVLHRERHGLWPKIRRVLFGNGLVRWLTGERP
jgi:hypothetical protein